MEMIRIEPPELEKALLIWIGIMGQRQPSLLRDLWSRRGDEYDRDKLDRTRREFARVLTQCFLTAKWNVLREELDQERFMREDDEKQLLLPRLLVDPPGWRD